jgi:hypothetical protein
VITGQIPRSADLLAVPHRNLREKLAPQARQVFRDLDEVAYGLPSSPIRSSGPLAGRVHLTGASRTLVGGDPWVPMSLSHHDQRCYALHLDGVIFLFIHGL